MEYLGLETSPPRRTFKKNLGQANHFLITIEVGLDAIREGRANSSSPTWTSWGPKSARRSADRSSGFASLATLSLLIDSLDAYASDIVSAPRLIQDPEVAEKVTKQSNTTKRFEALVEVSGLRDSVPWALVNVARAWRHRLLHRSSTAKPTAAVRQTLSANAETIKDRHSGLDAEILVTHLEEGEPPRFKETTAMIRGSHQLVEEVDLFWLATLDLEEFAREAIDAYLLADGGAGLTKRINNIWSKDENTTLRTLRNILTNAGLTLQGHHADRPAIATAVLRGLADQTADTAKGRLTDSS